MKNRFSSLMILFLCAALLLIGCDAPEGSSETENDSKNQTISETESNTFSESESESESESDSLRNQLPPLPSRPIHYEPLGESQAVVIRWKSPLTEPHKMGYPTEYEGLTAVEVELLRVYRRSFEYVRPYVPEAEVNTISVIYLPTEALIYAREGEESLVFLSESIVYTEGEVSVRIYPVDGYLLSNADELEDPQTYFPIFTVTEGMVSVPDYPQNPNSDNDWEYGATMYYLEEGNKFLKKKEDDPSYYFRDGMTLDQLEQFFYLTRASRP